MSHKANLIVDTAIDVLRAAGRMLTAAELTNEIVARIDRTPATVYTLISTRIAHDRRFIRERRRIRKGFSSYYYGLDPDADGAVA